MTRYGMIIDISRCTGCYNCFTACKDEYWDNDYLPYSVAQPKFGQFWMNLIKKERGTYPAVKVAYMPLLCMHCYDAPCIKAADDNAVYRRPDGIVIIDPERAVGQKQLMLTDSCPYGVIYWNEEKNLPQKCTFCVHRLEVGEIPRCVQACPTGCLCFGDLADTTSEISQLLKFDVVETLHIEYTTKPAVYYRDLYKITRYFIAGTVSYSDTDECAEGVVVSLINHNNSLRVITDNYGNYEFDGLDAGKYTISLDVSGYSSMSLRIDLKKDYRVDNIALAKA